jgi:cellulose synthase/poly-beta-1,6-N-acetylglucosamine synthase-like glycosyltransferase
MVLFPAGRIMPILLAILLVPATLAAGDSLVRALLLLRSLGALPPFAGTRLERWLVVIPARAEGARLSETLQSLVQAARGHDARIVLLLDGEGGDAHAEWPAEVEVIVKPLAGPSKAAALAWLAEERPEMIAASDAVLVLDAGSQAAPDLFDRFLWPAGADAVQTHLAGTGSGAGAGAAASEVFAQSVEDRGREALGWNVRLRGTGMAFRPHVFTAIMPRLTTRVEDHEASVLLTAAGASIRLAPTDALVLDDKPDTVAAAASQRSRWLLGRYELLFRRPGALLATIGRHPAEGLALFVEIFGRPLSLSVPLRLVAGGLAIRSGYVVTGSVVAASTAIDVACHLRAGSARDVARIASSWALALVLWPGAVRRWMRADRK